MPQTLTTNAAATALARVDDLLDLSSIRFKVANPEDGEPPSVEQLDLMETEYRRFLALRLAHPDSEIVPCKLVDEVWHRHILDTRAYAERPDLRRVHASLPVLRDARPGRRAGPARRLCRHARPLPRGLRRAAAGHVDLATRTPALPHPVPAHAVPLDANTVQRQEANSQWQVQI